MSRPQDRQVVYSPAGPTIKRFHQSEAFVRGIMGPIGSGKTTGCIMEILRRASLQLPGPDGKRRTRWAIIRNSYPELKTTTLKSWQDWCPAQYGRLTMDSPIRHHVTAGDLDMEVLFLALDRDEDVRKLLSLELTGAYLNEAREIPKAILDAMTGRVGRYPSVIQGGATWSGIVMDTNPPDDQGWWYKCAEEETPHGWEFFHQPPGDGKKAENLQNLPGGYYERLTPGKDEDWIKVYVKGMYGYLIEGKPVYPMFRDRLHVAGSLIPASPALPILVGADFGLTPAAILGQKHVDGRWQIIDELITDSCGVIRFAELLTKYIATNYPEHSLLPKDFRDELVRTGAAATELDPLSPETFRDVMGMGEPRKRRSRDGDPVAGFGDPAGNQRSQTDERTALDLMREHTGWAWKPAPTNDMTMRREVVVAALNRTVDGNPGLLISPKCKVLRKGFSSGYHYQFIRSSTGGNQVHESPRKNEYSHPHDALQYLLLGGGEHNVVLNRVQRGRRREASVASGMDYNPLS